MKHFFISIALTILLAGCVIFGFVLQGLNQQILVFVLIILLIAIIIKGYIENVKAIIWGVVSFFGAFWSFSKMFSSINFDAPFMLSFYWSTVGYLFLSIFLFCLGILITYQAGKKPFGYDYRK